jgi:hypothetical protein
MYAVPASIRLMLNIPVIFILLQAPATRWYGGKLSAVEENVTFLSKKFA